MKFRDGASTTSIDRRKAKDACEKHIIMYVSLAKIIIYNNILSIVVVIEDDVDEDFQIKKKNVRMMD